MNAYGPTPFAQPSYTVSSTTFSALFVLIFFLVFIIWVLYSLVVAYHWFRYGHSSWVAIPSIALHIFISIVLIFYIASGVS